MYSAEGYLHPDVLRHFSEKCVSLLYACVLQASFTNDFDVCCRSCSPVVKKVKVRLKMA